MIPQKRKALSGDENNATIARFEPRYPESPCRNDLIIACRKNFIKRRRSSINAGTQTTVTDEEIRMQESSWDIRGPADLEAWMREDKIAVWRMLRQIRKQRDDGLRAAEQYSGLLSKYGKLREETMKMMEEKANLEDDGRKAKKGGKAIVTVGTRDEQALTDAMLQFM